MQPTCSSGKSTLRSRSTESPLSLLFSLFLFSFFFLSHSVFLMYIFFILHVQQALTCVEGTERGAFYGVTAPPTGLMGKNSKVAELNQLFLSLPLPPRFYPPPSLSRTETQREFSSDGTVNVFCCFTLHTTQWAKACQTMVSAHFRFVSSFVLWV